MTWPETSSLVAKMSPRGDLAGGEKTKRMRTGLHKPVLLSLLCCGHHGVTRLDLSGGGTPTEVPEG